MFLKINGKMLSMNDSDMLFMFAFMMVYHAFGIITGVALKTNPRKKKCPYCHGLIDIKLERCDKCRTDLVKHGLVDRLEGARIPLFETEKGSFPSDAEYIAKNSCYVPDDQFNRGESMVTFVKKALRGNLGG